MVSLFTLNEARQSSGNVIVNSWYLLSRILTRPQLREIGHLISATVLRVAPWVRMLLVELWGKGCSGTVMQNNDAGSKTKSEKYRATANKQLRNKPGKVEVAKLLKDPTWIFSLSFIQHPAREILRTGSLQNPQGIL